MSGFFCSKTQEEEEIDVHISFRFLWFVCFQSTTRTTFFLSNDNTGGFRDLVVDGKCH